MPGPPPKDPATRRRRNVTPGFKALPAVGRTAPPPEWPIAGTPNFDEVQLWKRLWALPQAVEWERMRCEDIVALYVRSFVRATAIDADSKMLAEVRQLDAKIGLSPKAMRDLRWETDEPAEPEPQEEPEEQRGERIYVPPAP